MEIIKVYVGADRSQALAIKVLEFSIKRNTSSMVEVIPMVDLPVPVPKDPRNSQRTGFSFSRFCIPKLANNKGKAIYLDADMIVFGDIRNIWDINLNGKTIAIQSDVLNAVGSTEKKGAPKKRIKQCAVMLMDCEKAKWDIEVIIKQMDSMEFSYEDLMYNLCILAEDQIAYSIPANWNSLEHFDSNTCLLHYTDVLTQPWTSCRNRFGFLWLNEVRLMLKSGKLTLSDIKKEISEGYFRPSLLRDIKFRHLIPKILLPFFDFINEVADKASGYVAHKAVYEAKKIRELAIKKHMSSLG
ncbi:MAG: glycosyltransferase [Bacteriovoracia bacterium]